MEIKRYRTKSFSLADLIYICTSLIVLILIYLFRETLDTQIPTSIINIKTTFLNLVYTIAAFVLFLFLFFIRKDQIATWASLALLTFPAAPVIFLAQPNVSESVYTLIISGLIVAIILTCTFAITRKKNAISNVWIKFINYFNEIYSIIIYSFGLLFAKTSLDNYNALFQAAMNKASNGNATTASNILFALTILLAAQPITKIAASKKELNDTINAQKEILRSTLRLLILDERKIPIKTLGLDSKFLQVEMLLFDNFHDANNNPDQRDKINGALMAINEIQDFTRSHSDSHEYINEIGLILEEYKIINSYRLLALYNIPDRQPPQAAPFDSMAAEDQLELIFSAYMRNQHKEHIRSKALVS